MSEMSTSVIVPAFTSLSILCMKTRYEDTCAASRKLFFFMALVARAAGAAVPQLKAQQPQNARNQINPRGAPIHYRKTPDVVAYFLAKLQYYVNSYRATATLPAR